MGRGGVRLAEDDPVSNVEAPPAAETNAGRVNPPPRRVLGCDGIGGVTATEQEEKQHHGVGSVVAAHSRA